MTALPPAEHDPAMGVQARRVESSLTELNARIGVLAKVLGAELIAEEDPNQP